MNWIESKRTDPIFDQNRVPCPRREEIDLPGGAARCGSGVSPKIGVVRLTALIPYRNCRIPNLCVVLIWTLWGVYIGVQGGRRLGVQDDLTLINPNRIYTLTQVTEPSNKGIVPVRTPTGSSYCRSVSLDWSSDMWIVDRSSCPVCDSKVLHAEEDIIWRAC